MTYIALPHKKETMPPLLFGIEQVVCISDAIANLLINKIYSEVATQMITSNSNYERKEGEYEVELVYNDVVITISGVLHTEFRYFENTDRDTPSEWIIQSRYIEITDFDCIGPNDEFLMTDFDRNAFNQKQYKKRFIN